jgi:antitoxin component of MazEF toxin-antitoxin module
MKKRIAFYMFAVLLAMAFVACGEDEGGTTGTTGTTGSAGETGSTGTTGSTGETGTTAVSFTGLSANGTAASVTTTALTLAFDVDPTSLTADDITVTGATKGALSDTGLTRTLAITAITVADGTEVTVTIASPAGFTISPVSRNVAVNVAPTATALAFSGITANGTSEYTNTTELTLSFDGDPAGLTVDDITLTGATKGILSGTGTTRTLTISAITVTNGEEVSVALANPAGFVISPASRNVTVYVKIRYAIGDIGPSGVGIVFRVVNGGLNGLEAAPASAQFSAQWKTSNTDTPGATSTTSGADNTAAMVAGGEYPAADLCRAYSGGGKTDWFLPSTSEMVEMWNWNIYVTGLAGPVAGSNQRDAIQLQRYNIINGVLASVRDSYNPKTNTFIFRPIRAF